MGAAGIWESDSYLILKQPSEAGIVIPMLQTRKLRLKGINNLPESNTIHVMVFISLGDVSVPETRKMLQSQGCWGLWFKPEGPETDSCPHCFFVLISDFWALFPSPHVKLKGEWWEGGGLDVCSRHFRLGNCLYQMFLCAGAALGGRIVVIERSGSESTPGLDLDHYQPL